MLVVEIHVTRRCRSLPCDGSPRNLGAVLLVVCAGAGAIVGSWNNECVAKMINGWKTAKKLDRPFAPLFVLPLKTGDNGPIGIASCRVKVYMRPAVGRIHIVEP